MSICWTKTNWVKKGLREKSETPFGRKKMQLTRQIMKEHIGWWSKLIRTEFTLQMELILLFNFEIQITLLVSQTLILIISKNLIRIITFKTIVLLEIHSMICFFKSIFRSLYICMQFHNLDRSSAPEVFELIQGK